jgi:hypothetical protein
MQKDPTAQLYNSRQAVLDILLKHKLIADLVHKQDMPHHDLVETLVRKENMAQLQQILNHLPPAELPLFWTSCRRKIKCSSGSNWIMIISNPFCRMPRFLFCKYWENTRHTLAHLFQYFYQWIGTGRGAYVCYFAVSRKSRAR